MTLKTRLNEFSKIRQKKKCKKRTSCGLEAVIELLEEAASQLSLDSLRDHKNAPYSSNFSRVRCICQEAFALQPTVSEKLMAYQLLLPVYRRYYLQYNDYSKVLL